MAFLLCGVVHPQATWARFPLDEIQTIVPARVLELQRLLTLVMLTGLAVKSQLHTTAAHPASFGFKPELFSVPFWRLKRRRNCAREGVVEIGKPKCAVLHVQCRKSENGIVVPVP